MKTGNQSQSERELRDALDGSMWDASKPPMPAQVGNQYDELRLAKQIRTPIEKIKKLLNIEVFNENVLLEPHLETIYATAGAIEIDLSAVNKNSGIDTLNLYKRVLAISKTTSEKLGIVPGDYVLTGDQPVFKYVLNTLYVQETKSFNIVCKASDVEFHKAIVEWLGGRIDVFVKNNEERDKLEPFVGMKIRNTDAKTTYVYKEAEGDKADRWVNVKDLNPKKNIK